MELGADVGTFSPGPEVFFLLMVGVGVFKGEPLAFDGEAFGGETPRLETENMCRGLPDYTEVLRTFCCVRWRATASPCFKRGHAPRPDRA